MKVAEIIRAVLDIVDGKQTIPAPNQEMPNDQFYDDEIRRFRQIVDLQSSQKETEYSNTPREEYASIEAVTTAAGGGPNNPKHPHDIRVKDPSQHPGQQEY
jgi:hypothetical protein